MLLSVHGVWSHMERKGIWRMLGAVGRVMRDGRLAAASRGYRGALRGQRERVRSRGVRILTRDSVRHAEVWDGRRDGGMDEIERSRWRAAQTSI